MLPVTGTSSSGVLIVTVPSFELSGHVGWLVLLSAVCTELHAPSPFAEDGFTRTPAGSVTVAVLRSDWETTSGSSVCGTVRSKPNPVGAPALEPATGWAFKAGSNGTFSHPSTGSGAPQSAGVNG